MGKKDEKIKVLEQRVIDLMNERNGGEVEIERLHGVLKEKNEKISVLDSGSKAQTHINDQLKIENARVSEDLQNALKKKSLLGVSVNIAGLANDIIEGTLDKAETVVMSRLKKLKREDFDVLAHPHTLDIKLIR